MLYHCIILSLDEAFTYLKFRDAGTGIKLADNSLLEYNKRFPSKISQLILLALNSGQILHLLSYIMLSGTTEAISTLQYLPEASKLMSGLGKEHGDKTAGK